MHYRTVRRTYLITHSQANLEKFPSRQSFADCVVDAFQNGASIATVQHWVCCMENHADGGKHYHMAIKLSTQKRWKGAKKFLMDTYDISVHFSTRHDNYYSAYKYVTEEDIDALHSPGHPNLASGKSPKTKASTKALRRAAKQRRSLESEAKPGPSGVSKKKRRLSNLDVSELLLKNGIKRDIELLALANTQKAEGICDLAEFVLGKSDKSLKELIACTWKMENASKTLQRENKSRMSLIRQSKSEAQCVDGCNGNWQECALQVLKQNNVHPYFFASAVRDLLEKGRGTFRNLMIMSPANGGSIQKISITTAFAVSCITAKALEQFLDIGRLL